MSLNVRDRELRVTVELPEDGSTVASPPLDLGLTDRSEFVTLCEALITAPPLDDDQLPDGEGFGYSLQDSDAANFASPRAIAGEVIVQEGADGVGAAGTTARVRLPTDVRRYLRLIVEAADTSGAPGDASAAEAVLELVF